MSLDMLGRREAVGPELDRECNTADRPLVVSSIACTTISEVFSDRVPHLDSSKDITAAIVQRTILFVIS
jgi:hypothetical protein